MLMDHIVPPPPSDYVLCTPALCKMFAQVPSEGEPNVPEMQFFIHSRLATLYKSPSQKEATVPYSITVSITGLGMGMISLYV